LFDLIAEMMDQLVSQYFSRRNVISVAEAARQRQYLEISYHIRLSDQPVDVYRLSLRPGDLKSVTQLLITVRPCRS